MVCRWQSIVRPHKVNGTHVFLYNKRAVEIFLKKNENMGGFTDWLNTTGSSMGTSLAGSVIGSLGSQIGYGLGELTGYNDRLRRDQMQQQQQLTNMQYNANKSLMDASYANQLQMWKDTNFFAQRKELTKAGLNPALLYAKGGGGGSTGGGGAQVSGASASDETSRQMANNASIMQGMGLMKLQSEIKLNEAQADKLKAEVPKVGAETDLLKGQREKISTEIANISQDTQLKGEQVALNKLQQTSTEIANEFNEKQNLQLLEQSFQLIRELTARANVAEQTQQSLVELAKNNVQLSMTQILLNKSNVKLNDMEMSLIRNKIIEISNTIRISNRQIVVNEDALKQALEMKQMELSGGMIVNQVRGVATAIRNALMNKSDYKW